MRDYSIFDNLSMGVQVISPEMKYLYLNNKLLSEIELSAKEIVGHRMSAKFPGIEKTQIYKEICHCMETSCQSEFVNEFEFPDGRQAFYEIILEPVEEGVLIFSIDITNEKKGEAFLRETNRQLEQFTLFASHQLKEPVRRLGLLSEIVVSDISNALPIETRKALNTINEESINLLKLMDSLRYISDLAREEISREICLVHKVAIERMTNLQELISKGNINVHLPEEGLPVSADIGLLNVLLDVLFENSLLYCSSKIEFFINSNESSVPVFEIKNDLINAGLEENLDLFLPFVKGKSSSGLGLGLYIAKKIIERHKGKIWLDYGSNHFNVFFTLQAGL